VVDTLQDLQDLLAKAATANADKVPTQPPPTSTSCGQDDDTTTVVSAGGGGGVVDPPSSSSSPRRPRERPLVSLEELREAQEAFDANPADATAALQCARGNLDNEMPRLAIKQANALLDLLRRESSSSAQGTEENETVSIIFPEIVNAFLPEAAFEKEMEGHLIKGTAYLRMQKPKKAFPSFETAVACYDRVCTTSSSGTGESLPDGANDGSVAFSLYAQAKAGMRDCRKTGAPAASPGLPTSRNVQTSASTEFAKRRLQGKSEWNSKNTWEEVDMTDWAMAKLQQLAEGIVFVPPSTGQNNASSSVSQLKTLQLQNMRGFCQVTLLLGSFFCLPRILTPPYTPPLGVALRIDCKCAKEAKVSL
jgi:hypothetical protein